jgi:nicotinamidase-related amidase
MRPSFWDPSKVGEVWVERAGAVAEEARRHRTRPTSEDRVRVAAFGIDVQIGFCTPGASLFVPGAVEDTRRAVEWLYDNVPRLTTLALSLDTHEAFQIFHPAWWEDERGEPPAPLTPIRAADVRAGRWRARRFAAQSAEYVEKLEASGKYVLTVWPYHTLLGGVSHALVPAMMEAALFWSIARDTPARFEVKGRNPKTESYSVLAPEVTEVGGESVGGLNRSLLDELARHDRVYVFGQAKSHCVLSTLRDVARIAPDLLGKVWVLEDAMSPVPAPPIDPLPPALDFPKVAERAFAELVGQGMHVCRTTDPIA